ncbi:MAG: hypothetical protein P8H13_03240 [Polaribacter sp.]|nr:hypothetical protein [Polaribacter sp.]MDG1810939.1 hypothetical protein [Polaribacter sp.]MDG1994020.1 hypothetical protein [Polaribacter sp.]
MKKTCIVLILSLIFINLCKAQKKSPKVNTNFNKEFRKNIKSFSGKFSKSKYKDFKKILERELDTIIPEGKTIIIHYNQKAPNCPIKRKYLPGVTKNKIRISSSISSKYNAVDFFVYSKDTYHKDFFQNNKNYILDSGYFYKAIFTLHKICSAFLVLKPNGEILKHYDADYFSQMGDFLKSSIKIKPKKE